MGSGDRHWPDLGDQEKARKPLCSFRESSGNAKRKPKRRKASDFSPCRAVGVESRHGHQGLRGQGPMLGCSLLAPLVPVSSSPTLNEVPSGDTERPLGGGRMETHLRKHGGENTCLKTRLRGEMWLLGEREGLARRLLSQLLPGLAVGFLFVSPAPAPVRICSARTRLSGKMPAERMSEAAAGGERAEGRQGGRAQEALRRRGSTGCPKEQ